MDWPTAWSTRCRAFENLQSNALGKHGPKKYGAHFSHFCVINNPQSRWCIRSLFFGVRCEWTCWSQLGLPLILRSGGADLGWACLSSWALKFRSSWCLSSNLLQASHSQMQAEVMQQQAWSGKRESQGKWRGERERPPAQRISSHSFYDISSETTGKSKHMSEPQAEEIHCLWWRQWPNSTGKGDTFDSPA